MDKSDRQHRTGRSQSGMNFQRKSLFLKKKRYSHDIKDEDVEKKYLESIKDYNYTEDEINDILSSKTFDEKKNFLIESQKIQTTASAMRRSINKEIHDIYKDDKLLSALMILSSTVDGKWVSSFGDRGINGLFKHIQFSQRKNLPTKAYYCLKILQNLLNFRKIFNIVIENEQYIESLWKTLDTTNSNLIDITSITLGALCTFDHQKVLDALTNIENEWKEPRFKIIIDVCKSAEPKAIISIFKLLNAILNKDDIHFRIVIRMELRNLNFDDIVVKQIMGDVDAKELYIDYIESEQDDYKNYFKNLEYKVELLNEESKMFKYLFANFEVNDASLEFKSILQHLLMIIAAGKNIKEYIRLFEKLIGEISASNSFNMNLKYNMVHRDINSVLDSLNYEKKYRQSKGINIALENHVNNLENKIVKLRSKNTSQYKELIIVRQELSILKKRDSEKNISSQRPFVHSGTPGIPLPGPTMPPTGPGMPPTGPGMPPPGPGMPPTGPGMPPTGPGMPPTGPGMPPPGPGMPPTGPGMPPTGPGMPPTGPGMPPTGPGMPPPGPGMPPPGPGMPPPGPGMPPTGPGMPPTGPGMPPPVPSMPPPGPSMPPPGPDMPPPGPGMPPTGPGMPPPGPGMPPTGPGMPPPGPGMPPPGPGMPPPVPGMPPTGPGMPPPVPGMPPGANNVQPLILGKNLAPVSRRGLGSNAIRNLPKKVEHTSNVPLKRIGWTKLPNRRINAASMWIRIDEEKMYDDSLMADMENFFAQSQQKSKQNTAVVTKKGPSFHIIDAKLGQNIGILLNSAKLKPLQAADYVLNLSNNLDISFIETLFKTLPDDELIKQLSKLSAPDEDCHGSEIFCREISKIKYLKAKLEDFIFIKKYPEIYGMIKSVFEITKNATKSLKLSNNLEKFFGFCLLIGNILNSGTASGKAIAIDPESIIKMNDLKSKDKKLSLMEYIVKNIEERHQEVSNFVFELEFVVKASKVSYNDALGSYRDLEKNFVKLKSSLEKIKLEEPSSKYNDIVFKFLEETDEEMKDLIEIDSMIKKDYEKILVEFSLEKKKYELSKIITVFSEIITNYKKVKEEYSKKKLAEERKLKIKASSAENKNLHHINEDIASSKDGNENLMNDLMSSLNLKKTARYRSRT